MVHSRGILTRSLIKPVALYALFLTISIQAATTSSLPRFLANSSITPAERPIDVATKVPSDNLASVSTDTSADDITTISQSPCHLVAANADLKAGLNITTDHTCSSGGVGCIDSICRICKTRAIDYSEIYPDCPGATDNEVRVTVSEGEGSESTRDIQSSPELVLFGFVGVVVAVALTVVAMRRKLLEPMHPTPMSLSVEIEDDVHNEEGTPSKPSTPSTKDKTCSITENKV